MAISVQILGKPGNDNALLVRIDSGQQISRLLFDCGEGCLNELPPAEVLGIDHLFFSHLHMDHVSGFDTFFRANYSRESKPNRIWGPPETASILQHRFRGYWWNLTSGQPGAWRIHEVHGGVIHTSLFELADAFASRHDEESKTVDDQGVLLEAKDYTVETLTMDHHGPSLAYLVRERPQLKVDARKIKERDLVPGPWVRDLLDDPGPKTVEISGKTFDLAELRQELLTERSGDSVAYLTDFHLDDQAMDRLVPWLNGCDTLICEAQYRHDDLALAQQHHHATTRLVGELARRANVGRLILIHLSRRYNVSEWLEMLGECRDVFPRAAFPENWQDTLDGQTMTAE